MMSFLRIYKVKRNKILKSKDPNRSISGSIYIELAVFLPLLCMVGFFGLELARLFLVYETMSSVSREAAREAASRCAYHAEIPFVDSCLKNDVFPGMKLLTESAIKASEVVISIYRIDPTDPTKIILASIAGAVDAGNGVFRTPLGFSSKYTPESLGEVLLPSTGVQALQDDKDAVAVSEVFFRHRTFSLAYQALQLDDKLKSGVVYETTIF